MHSGQIGRPQLEHETAGLAAGMPVAHVHWPDDSLRALGEAGDDRGSGRLPRGGGRCAGGDRPRQRRRGRGEAAQGSRAVRRHDQPAPDPHEAPHPRQRPQPTRPAPTACSDRRAGGPAKGRARIVATRAKELRLHPGRTRTVRLRLIRAGRRELRTCVPRKVIANGLRLRGEKRLPGRTRRRARHSASTPRAAGATAGAAAAGTPPPPRAQEPIAYKTENAGRCDFIDDGDCLFPWPNDHFTVADPTTDTGRRLNLQARLDAGERRRQGHQPGRTTATTASAPER